MKEKSKYGAVGKFFKIISRIISYTLFIILIIIAIFLAYYTLSSRAAAKKGQKFEAPISLYTIISPSMTPNINIYDVVVSKKVKSPNDIKVGDVITFISTSQISRGMTVTHRVVEIVKDENGIAYKTKGDNNLSPDGAPAEYNNVIGKVVLKIPKLGRLQEFISSKGGWIIAIVLPALIIIISDIVKIIRLSSVKNKINKLEEQQKQEQEEKQILEENRKEELKEKLDIEEALKPEENINEQIDIQNLVDKIDNKQNIEEEYNFKYKSHRNNEIIPQEIQEDTINEDTIENKSIEDDIKENKTFEKELEEENFNKDNDFNDDYNYNDSVKMEKPSFDIPELPTTKQPSNNYNNGNKKKNYHKNNNRNNNRNKYRKNNYNRNKYGKNNNRKH